jgi:hypothetical protein
LAHVVTTVPYFAGVPLSWSSRLLSSWDGKADALRRVESLNERVRDVNKTVEEGRRIDDDKVEDIKDDLKTFKEDLKTLCEGPDGELHKRRSAAACVG